MEARGDLERALQYYREALSMKPESEQAVALNNIALVHHKRKEYSEAIKLLRQAIDIDRCNGKAHSTAIYQINLGNILREAKQYQAAEKELLAGLNAIRLVGDKNWEATACYNLGSLANDDPQKRGIETRQWFAKAEALFREIESLNCCK